MNSRRYTMTSLSIVFLALTIVSVSAIGQNAYAAAGGGMSLSVDCSGATCDVSGSSDRTDLDVAIILKSSNGIHDVAQATVSGGSYSASFNVSNLNDGTYTIEANQVAASDSSTGGKYFLFVDIDVSGGSSDSSVSVDNIVQRDVESYVGSQNTLTADELKKLTITASGIEGSTTINVMGTTDRSEVIIIKVLAPNGNLVSIDQVTPTGGSYATTIFTGGSLWSQDGMYTISATQTSSGLKQNTETFVRAADSPNAGLINYQASAEVEILDGHVIPEFGVIAAMILAVAIVSIIVVTAKTKLSIVPRY